MPRRVPRQATAILTCASVYERLWVMGCRPPTAVRRQGARLRQALSLRRPMRNPLEDGSQGLGGCKKHRQINRQRARAFSMPRLASSRVQARFNRLKMALARQAL